MDQFASAMGKKDHAIFLDTATLQYEYAPVKMENAKIVITNSKVKHSLVDSKYNERRQQCEEAVRDLRKVEELAHIKSLGELDRETFEKYETAITDPICRMRARHAVCENQRTIQAVQALKDGDLAGFGRLMNASHVSLRDDYQVSCDEIDLLVDLAWEIPGVLGARITGGGFGGCTVSIVENEAVDRYKESIQRAYEKRVGHKAEFYVVDIGDGAYAF
jgi:Galactokinase